MVHQKVNQKAVSVKRLSLDGEGYGLFLAIKSPSANLAQKNHAQKQKKNNYSTDEWIV
jgi:hypothetical protein